MANSDSSETVRELTPGQKAFDRYTLKKVLGRGGMGVVWLAQDDKLEEDVALKFLPEIVKHDPSALDELKRETRRARQLTHAHIVRIYDFVEDAMSAAIAMEPVEGGTLSKLRVAKPNRVFSVDEISTWVRQLCEALDYAHHEARVVHRDLKPANLMIDGRGRLKVTDFGIARSISDSVSRVSNQAGSSGTPVYMSPQQMLGERPAATDDIYALGATIFELLTGRPPFFSGNIITQVQSRLPPSMTERRTEFSVVAADVIPSAWEETVAACLAKEAAKRPQSAAEVARRLGLGEIERRAEGAPPTGQAKPAPGVAVQTPGRPPDATVSPAAEGRPATAGGAWSRALPNRKIKVTVAFVVVGLLAVTGLYFGIRHAGTASAVRGGIIVRTNPAGAKVVIENLDQGVSPVTIKNAKAGRYPVKIQADGYEDWSGEAQVKENEFTEMNVSLVRSMGAAQITSVPTGLTFTLVSPERTERGLTPARFDSLPTGEYTLTVRRDDWPDARQSVTVTRGRQTPVVAEFIGGGLEIISVPAGAEVMRDGKRLGVTPVKLEDMAPGTYELELRCKGYKTMGLRDEIQPRQWTRKSVELERMAGPETGQSWTLPGLELTLLPIASGSFTMGSANEAADERPLTRVVFSRRFWMGRTEITQNQWRAVMGGNPAIFAGDDRPVENVSWTEATDFCRKLTERERAAGRLPPGYAFTLPTEAQWEYACRAGGTGDAAGGLASVAWYGQNSGNQTHPVAQKQANAWGLFDTQGSVWEWCRNWYGAYPGGTVADPKGPASGTVRVYRGGSWDSNAANCRPSCRGRNQPDHRARTLGFRVCLSDGGGS